MKFKAYTDAEFAPNESIRKNEIVPYHEIEKTIYHEQVGKTKASIMLPFMRDNICLDWGIKITNTTQDFKVAKRILLRSIVCN